MPYTTEAPSAADLYASRWEALLAQVHAGVGLRDELRDAIEAWGRTVQPEPKVEKEPEKRCQQVQSKIAALAEHFSGVVGRVSVWAEGLKPHLRATGAHLNGLLLFGAVDEMYMAFARAEKRTLPPCPKVTKLDNAAELEARVAWLKQVDEMMPRVEAGPREIGAALRALEETLDRFEAELERAKVDPRLSNTQALRWQVPSYPLSRQPEPAARAPRRVDPYAFLTE
jgi:hypothetical protein